MGSGPFRLLEKIRKHKSTNRASKEVNVSYVKALKMLNRLEKNLGQQLFIRKRGGNERGGTELTPYAESYIGEYGRLQKTIMRHANREFHSFAKRVAKKKQNA